MTDLREDSFGLLIAYVVPGFLAVIQFADFAPPLYQWLAAHNDTAPTVAGFLFVTLASIGFGLTTSTIRWLFVDTLHHWTGIRAPKWSFRELQPNIDAFLSVVQNHYRYYQFYGNVLVVLCLGMLLGQGAGTVLGLSTGQAACIDLSLILLFGIASRDSLQKYYARSAELLLRR